MVSKQIHNGTGMRLHASRNDLPAAVRTHMVVMLNQQLADTSDLYSQTKQAHWNVRGPEFYQLHLLFDQLAADVVAYIDLIAERVTALGGDARGTVRMAATDSRLPEFPSELSDGMQFVDVLAERYAHYAASLRVGMDDANKVADLATNDLLTEIARGIDKDLWFLDAHTRR